VRHDDAVIDHLGISCSDLDRSAAFYDAVLGVLGHRRLMDHGVAIGYGTDHPSFWLSAQPAEGPASGPNREIHVAFTAPSADAVRAFFDTAVSLGAEVLHEPRLWPEYHDRYFGAFLRDPDGNNIEAVCHAGE
jgi:catechol 2,3-dioxygenase-like lactoylglutathione lyase family enzyme